MWPWEHIAVGYLLYSGYVHLRDGESPTALASLAVIVGALFPDLVDKPLAWTFDVLQSGISLAHSVLTALALTAAVTALGMRGRRDVAAGFSVAYLAHLPADALYPALLGDGLTLRAFFWPLVTLSGNPSRGFIENFAYYAVTFLDFLGTPRGMLFLGLEVTLLGTAFVVWVLDGCPGLVDLWPSRAPEVE